MLEKDGDYLDVNKPNKVVEVPRDDQSESRVAKRKADIFSRREGRSSKGNAQ